MQEAQTPRTEVEKKKNNLHIIRTSDHPVLSRYEDGSSDWQVAYLRGRELRMRTGKRVYIDMITEKVSKV